MLVGLTIDSLTLEKTMLTPWPYPFWFAHRGAGHLAPENTMAALKLGAHHGFSAFECDVKLSSDDIGFLMHDTTLDRTTTEHGAASDWTWDELKRLDAGSWHSPNFKEERIPSLNSVLEWAQNGGYTLNLEIKSTPGNSAHCGATIAAQVQASWDAMPDTKGPTPTPLLSSYYATALAGAKQSAPRVPRALLVHHTNNGWLHTAQELGCSACVLYHELVTTALVEQVKSHGMRVLVYTVNDAREVSRLMESGVDGIITDAIDRFNPRSEL
jgi:glycerophosphoryl diester phosphodiesterase